MARLTKKDKYGHFYTNQANCRNIWSSDGKKLEGEYFENKTLAIDGKAIDKLGQLEDIEEELGIDLITLLNASMNGFYALYIDGRVDPDKWEPGYFIIDMKNRCFRSLTIIDSLGKTTFYFNEYGKTWTLTKRRRQK